MRSRLQKRFRQNSKRTIILMGIAILAIAYVFVAYGIPFLANASLMLAGSTKEDVILQTKEKTVFIEPPIFDSFPEATNTATITLTGISKKGTTVSLYVNDELVDTIDTNSDENFTFKRVALEEGKNFIKARASENNKKSDFTETIAIRFLKDAPEITLESPNDNQKYEKDEKTAVVKGQTDPDIKVTVNDAWAIIDGSGTFTYNLSLHDGENSITIVGTDPAGNKTEIKRSVTYSP